MDSPSSYDPLEPGSPGWRAVKPALPEAAVPRSPRAKPQLSGQSAVERLNPVLAIRNESWAKANAWVMGGSLIVSQNSPHVSRTQILLQEGRSQELRDDWRKRTQGGGKATQQQPKPSAPFRPGWGGGPGSSGVSKKPVLVDASVLSAQVRAGRLRPKPKAKTAREPPRGGEAAERNRARTAMLAAEAALEARTDALRQRVEEVRARHAERTEKYRKLEQRQHARWVESRLRTGLTSVLQPTDPDTRRAIAQRTARDEELQNSVRADFEVLTSVAPPPPPRPERVDGSERVRLRAEARRLADAELAASQELAAMVAVRELEPQSLDFVGLDGASFKHTHHRNTAAAVASGATALLSLPLNSPGESVSPDRASVSSSEKPWGREWGRDGRVGGSSTGLRWDPSKDVGRAASGRGRGGRAGTAGAAGGAGGAGGAGERSPTSVRSARSMRQPTAEPAGSAANAHRPATASGDAGSERRRRGLRSPPRQHALLTPMPSRFNKERAALAAATARGAAARGRQGSARHGSPKQARPASAVLAEPTTAASPVNTSPTGLPPPAKSHRRASRECSEQEPAMPSPLPVRRGVAEPHEQRPRSNSCTPNRLRLASVNLPAAGPHATSAGRSAQREAKPNQVTSVRHADGNVYSWPSSAGAWAPKSQQLPVEAGPKASVLQRYTEGAA